MKFLVALLVGMGMSLATAATPLPYDETANPRVDLQQALNDANEDHKDVLIVFGANWCEDCRDLDQALHGSSAGLIGSHFLVVKVNVGNFDRNLDLSKRYGNPIAKGIPAVVVVTPANEILYATKAGELANARRMSESGIYDFFARVVAAHSSQPSPKN